MVDILTEPRNAMVRQYAKLLAMEGVELSFTDSALRELARIARGKGTGARGLRAILEHIMLDVMYDIPARTGRQGMPHYQGRRQRPARPPGGREGTLAAHRVIRGSLQNRRTPGRVRAHPAGACLVALAAVLLCSGPALCREVSITLLHTADVRGHVLSLRHREWEGYHGGLLRCATVIDDLRGSLDNVLLLDAGGLVHGSPESYLSRGLLVLKAASLMGYDARVAGCREAMLEPSAIEGAVYLAHVPVLGADGAPGPAGEGAAPFLVRSIDGVYVAVVGLSGCGAGDQGPDPFPALEHAMAQVRARQPDLIVLLAHLAGDPFAAEGENPLRAVLKKFPDLDVALGGGSGEVVRSANLGGILYSQAGADARWLGRVDLVYDTVRKKLVSRAADVIEIGPEVPVHAPLSSALGPSLGRITRALDREVGQTARRLLATSSTPGQSDVQELIGRALAEASGADVVLTGTAGLGGLAKGPIRWRDVIRAVPDQQALAAISIPAVELRRVLEENMSHLDDASFLGIHGAQYEWAEEEAGQGSVRNLVLSDGTRPHGRRRLQVAFDPAVLGEAGRDALREAAAAPTSRLEETSVDIRSLVAAYIEQHGTDDLRRGSGFVRK